MGSMGKGGALKGRHRRGWGERVDGRFHESLFQREELLILTIVIVNPIVKEKFDRYYHETTFLF